jgi:hypothetical protein
MLTGVPGCGKTTYYRKKLRKGDVIVTPTHELADVLRVDVKIKSVYTEHAVFMHTGKVNRLVIDEAFTFYPSKILTFINYLKPTEVYLVGDPGQIISIPFDKRFQGHTTLVSSYNKIDNMTTHRGPHDSTRLMRKHGYDGMQTTSGVVRSMSVYDCTLDQAVDLQKRLNVNQTKRNLWHFIAYNQSTYRSLAARADNCTTVHGSEGSAYRNVILYVDPKAMHTHFEKSLSHVHVAMTRHNTNLLIVGQSNSFLREAFHTGSQLDVNGAIFGQERSDVFTYTDDSPPNPSVLCENI